MGLRVGKEVIFYGLVMVGSGLSQLIDYWMVPDFYKLYAAWSFLVIGILAVIIGLLWRWGSWERPLGVTLLAISYGLIGLIFIILGGWLFVPLFLLALVFFVVAWALFKGKTWGRLAVYVITGISLLLSLIGIRTNGVIDIPGLLQSMYIFWYLNRSHVVEYFGAESLGEIKIPRKILIFPLVLTFVLVPLLVNVYINPPTYTMISDRLEGWGTGPGGGSGQYFFAKRGDLLAYSFEVDVDSAPVRFYIESSEYPPVLLASSEGRSGSGLVEVPFTSQWIMWAISQGTYMSVQVEVRATQFSLRENIVQWLLLDLYIAAFVFSLIITFRRVKMSYISESFNATNSTSELPTT
jgi:hypothetical protein